MNCFNSSNALTATRATAVRSMGRRKIIAGENPRSLASSGVSTAGLEHRTGEGSGGVLAALPLAGLQSP
jgi:hypothetical protein